MVHDLEFQSHPGKPLEVHIEGVIKGAVVRSNMPITRMAALFHDAGKINPNFQLKLAGKKANGYSNHSNLSALAFLSCAINNMELLKGELNIENNNAFALKVLQIAILIARHHRPLPNFEDSFSDDDDFDLAKEYAINQIKTLPIWEFYKNKMKCSFDFFKLNDPIKSLWHTFSTKLHKQEWKKDALNNFLDTQFSFASLIEPDKRDAGNNTQFYFKSAIRDSVKELDSSLLQKFQEFDQHEPISELNKLRTAIRLEALVSVSDALDKGKRVFTLTAPTGAGKTLTLLSIANKIRKQKGDLGIIYSLPFLSIIEQVQEISSQLLNDVLPVNSKTDNPRIDEAQLKYEANQNAENLNDLLKENFIQNTFDHPFIITTFVQFFETLVSNKNSSLLKLPNFANRIFLIDEIQALPPRLYIFFSALLHSFCKKNNSYAILSTATMPKLTFPKKNYDDDELEPEKLFKLYSSDLPYELIEPEYYFKKSIFNRYRINIIPNKQTIDSLQKLILTENHSCLVILNTIADTRALYDSLLGKLDVLILINTYFFPDDRTRKIEYSKKLLKKNKKFVLISTQLIEAGVDIDFPVVYRDLCPLPSLIQSAGRCNRNKNFEKGKVVFFQLVNATGQSRANLIYRKEAKKFLEFCKDEILDGIEENQLFGVQSRFFEYIKENLSIGVFDIAFEEGNMIKYINNAKFKDLGTFKLIDNNIGEQWQYYVLKNDDDKSIEEASAILDELASSKSYKEKQTCRIALNTLIKKMSGRILNIRVNRYNKPHMPMATRGEIMGIKFITEADYSENLGLKIANIENCFL